MSTTTKHPTPGERVDGFGREILKAAELISGAVELVPDVPQMLANADIGEADRARRSMLKLRTQLAQLWTVVDGLCQDLEASVEDKRASL